MDRKFNIGDRVICSEGGVIGKVLRFYIPTSCAEQTLVITDDGRQYHAPTNTWRKYNKGTAPSIIITDEYAGIFEHGLSKTIMFGGGM